jgi:hypothetical protein
LAPSWAEKITMLPVKKLQYLIVILVMSGTPASIEELTEILSFRDKSFFGRNYLKPLEAVGFIKKTNPEKPKAPHQKMANPYTPFCRIYKSCGTRLGYTFLRMIFLQLRKILYLVSGNISENIAYIFAKNNRKMI